MNKTVVLAFALILVAASAGAEGPCPCVPLTYTWMASPCDSWNCAASALVMADGDPNVVVMPTRSEVHKWVVLRRVVSGSITVSPDAPFLVEQFSTMAAGSARFSSLAQEFAPLLITPTDGNFVVVFLKEGEKKRATTH